MAKPAIQALHQPRGGNVPTMLFNLSMVAAAFFSLISGWPTDHPAWIVLVTIVLAYFQHCWTIIFHEDAHYSLYAARWHNIFNGRIVGTLLLIPFEIFRQVHIRHHARMNTPDDFEQWPYCDPTKSLRFRRVFLVIDILLGAWVAPFIYNRAFFVRNTPMKDPAIRRKVWFEFGIMFVFWSVTIGLVAYYGAWRGLVLGYVIPAVVTGWIQTIRKLTEHLGLPAGDPMRGARTVLPQRPMGRWFAWTSFHIESHGLHHKFPQMPHRNLEKAYALLEDGETAPEVTFSTYWQAIRDMLPHLRRPGIGVNAPGQPNGHPAAAMSGAGAGDTAW